LTEKNSFKIAEIYLSQADGLFIFAYSCKNETKKAAADMKKLKINALR